MTSGDKRRLKIGILGADAAAQCNYLPATKAWSDRLELKTVCDLDGDGARRFGALYEADAVFTDYEEMLANADIDAVATLIPHERHAEQVLMALEHGKHVLIEKPMAATLEDALKICEAAESKGLHVLALRPTCFIPDSAGLCSWCQMGPSERCLWFAQLVPAWGLGRVTERPPTSVGFIRAAQARCPA